MVFKQDIGIGIRMGIDTAPFWVNPLRGMEPVPLLGNCIKN